MRINKYFTENGICSRREADRWVEAGRISINGQTAKLGDQVKDGDVVALDGKPLKVKEKRPIIIAYHKPVGVECTSDPSVERNIINAVNYPGERLVHIGRLDLMSEGLILLTNLGDIVNKILRSRHEHEKEYIVTYDKPVDPRDLRQWQRGVDIGDEDRGPTKPCHAELLSPNQVRLILTEGRNRQIRRMAEALGYRVTRLKRVRIMHIELGDLRGDTWREFSQREIDDLLAALE